MPAGRLAIGCQIVTRAGPALRLETEHPTGKLQAVYNFEVAATIPTLLAKLGSGYTITATVDVQRMTNRLARNLAATAILIFPVIEPLMSTESSSTKSMPILV